MIEVASMGLPTGRHLHRRFNGSRLFGYLSPPLTTSDLGLGDLAAVLRTTLMARIAG